MSDLRHGVQRIDLRRHDEVTFGQPIYFVRPQRHFDLTPTQQQVGMMSLLLGDRAYTIDEIQSLFEVRKGEYARNMMFIHHLPLRKLVAVTVQLISLERWHTAAAGNTGFAG